MAKSGFRGGALGGGGQANMMRQAQKMQEDLLRMQEELESREYSASSGGGAVKATVTGKRELTALSISPDVIDPEDIDMLTDLIIAAVNAAVKEADKAASDNMSRLTGGLNLGALGL